MRSQDGSSFALHCSEYLEELKKRVEAKPLRFVETIQDPLLKRFRSVEWFAVVICCHWCAVAISVENERERAEKIIRLQW